MRVNDCLKGVRWIAYSSDFAKQFSPNGSIVLCWVIWNCCNSGNLHGEFEATIEQIANETGLGLKMVVNAKKKLGSVLKVKKKRLEHRTFYSINEKELLRVMGGAK